MVFAGRLVDSLGCRKGYPIVTGFWSLAAMGHALVHSVFGFSVARFVLGLGESGNFPAAIKATAEWFPPKERALATGIFNSGAGVGAILAPLAVPWVALHFGWRASFLITGFQRGLDRLVVDTLSHAARSKDWSRDGVALAPPSPHRRMVETAPLSPDLGIHAGQVPHRPRLVVLSFSGCRQYFNSRFKLDLSHIGLPLVMVYVVSMFGSVFGGWLPRGYMRLGMA